MSAHIPRKVFAKSFVVTVTALPALALACHDDPPMSHNPPMPTETATASASATTATPSASTTASPAPVATTAPTATVATNTVDSWTVSISNGKCEAMFDSAPCPPGDSCNPPPPVAYPCPKGASGPSYPLKVSRAAGKEECTATFTVYGGGGHCPAGMHCNPPPPHTTTIAAPCPK